MKSLVQNLFFSLAALGLFGGMVSRLHADEPKSSPASASTNAPVTKVQTTEVTAKTASQSLTGAELYSIHCNRCHQERYPTERTGAQWKTIMLHMQVRANIPVSQSKLILQYLQDNSGR